MSLPTALAQNLAELCEGLPKAELQEARRLLTQRYHQGGPIAMDSNAQRLSYLATRMPATFQVVKDVLARIPGLDQVKSLLDLGTGPGTVLWALESHISLERAHLVEQDLGLLNLARTLGTSLQTPKITHHHRALEVFQEWPQADLVSMSYVWAELAQQTRQELLEKAYTHTGLFLVLIEPGTPHHAQGLLEARDFLVKKGAYIIAPCPHAFACPIASPDWCHFSAHVTRNSLHRQVKGAHHPFELEKYSYLVVSKSPVPTQKGRLVRPPLKRKGHFLCDVCTKDGALKRRCVSRRDRENYASVKKKNWGDTWDF
jgi:ribosomal protein RSM22 (predicted rRNA methylase)